MNILIIGYGVVGKNIKAEFKNADIHDPALGYCAIPNKQYDMAFVAVPTPKKEDGSCDFSIVEKVISDTKNVNVFCIRSTIPPGTTEYLKEKYKARVVFAPEYSGETIHNLSKEFNFIILGGEKEDCNVAANAFIEIKSAYFDIHYTDSKTAELAKYMENSYLGLIVSFCNEFAEIAKKLDVDYNQLRECFIKDHRVPKSHTFYYENKPRWNSICLNKDIPAIISIAKASNAQTFMLDAIMKYKRDN